MKSPSFILNIVLLVAVVILYVLHFKKPSDDHINALPIAPANIVYVNTDSLLDRYLYFKGKKEEFEKKNEQVRSELNAEGDRLQTEVSEYQQIAKAMTPEERAKKEEELMTKQQKLLKRKDALMAALDEEQNKFHDTLYSKLFDFFKKSNRTKNYAFVLGYSKGGGILYANDSLDITGKVVEGLNKESEK